MALLVAGLGPSAQAQTVADIRPKSGAPGTSVRIYGSGFDTDKTDVVTIGGQTATIDDVLNGGTTMDVTIPSNASGGTVDVTVEIKSLNRTVTLSGAFDVVTGGTGAFPLRRPVDETNVDGAVATAIGDIDGNGTRDLLVGSLASNTVRWYAGDGSGNFDGGTEVASGVNYPRDVALVDLDQDGTLDILVMKGRGESSDGDNTIRSYLNTNGDGQSFSTQDVATSSDDLDGPTDMAIGDLNGDGIPDVVTTSSDNNAVYAYLNVEAASGNYTQTSIQGSGAGDPRAVDVADVDGDGTPDVIVGSVSDDNVSWFPNDGTATFGAEQVIASTGAVNPRDVDLVNLDGDADLEVLVAQRGSNGTADDGAVALYDGTSGSWTKTIIATTDSVLTTAAGDVDADGDLDIVAGSVEGENLMWYENTGGGSFATGTLVRTGRNEVQDVTLADLDGDATLDLVTVSPVKNALAFYPNVLPPSITVDQGGTPINDGETFDAGTTPQGTDLTTTFTVSNTGEAPLEITSASVTNADFFSVSPSTATISAGENATFDVTLDGANTGTESTGVTFASNDPATPSLSFFVTGEVITPKRVTQVQPQSGAPGTEVRIYGTGFDNDKTDVVTIGGQTATINNVLNGGAAMDVTVPSGTGGGTVDVSVEFTGGTTSTLANTFDVVTGGSGTFAALGAGLTGVDGSSSWGDYDGDGDLDLVVTGRDGSDSNDETATIYRNDGGGTFTDISAGLTGVEDGSSSWGDYDGDGDLDLVVTGRDGSFNETATIYRNDGGGTFTDIGAGLTGVRQGSSSWGDYDGDGDLDLVVTGWDADNNETATIYRNDGGGTFTDISAGLTGVKGSSSSWGDYDGDGDLDLVVSGSDSDFNETATIYRNDGGGTFADIGAGLTGVSFGSTSWGDYDGDGDLDLVITGNDGSGIDEETATIYRNEGGGTFTDIGAGLMGVRGGPSSWGDVDGDGDLDLVVTGNNGSSDTATIYRNEGGGTFASVGAGLTGVSSGSSSWGDVDGDGDLDLLITGQDPADDPSSTIYENLPPPSITVEQGGTLINDGETFDAGTTPQGTDLTTTFTVSNTGEAPLEITSASVTNADFFNVAPSTATISAGESATFDVALDGASTGTQSTGVTFESNDPATSSFTFAVTAKVVLDATPPSISNVTLGNDGADNLAFTFDTDEPLGGNASAVTVTVDGPISGADVYSFDRSDFSESGSGPYTYTLSPSQSFDDGDGTYTAAVDDAVDRAGNNGGNNGTGSGLSANYTFDGTPPIVTAIARASASPTNASSVGFKVSFSETVNNLGPTDFALSNQPGGTATIDGISTTGDTTITVASVSGDGPIGLNVADGDNDVLDAAGNPLDDASEPPVDETYTIDNAAPIISGVSLGVNASDELTLSFDSDAPLGTGSAAAQVSVDGPSTPDVYTFTRTDFAESGSGPYTYTLSPSQSFDDGDGTYTAAVDDAVDPAGNNGGNNGAGSGLSANHTFDGTPPTITGVALGTPGSTGEAVRIDAEDAITLRVTSDEPLELGSSALTVSIDGPSAGTDWRTFSDPAFSETDNGDGTFTYALQAAAAFSDGPGTYTAAVDVAKDRAGNDGASGQSDTALGVRIDVQAGTASRGQPVPVDVTVEGGFDATASPVLKARRGGTSAYRTVSLSVDESLSPGTDGTVRLSGQVPDSLVTTRGIDYYLQLSDGATLLTVPAGGTSRASARPAHLPVSFQQLAPPQAIKNDLFRPETYRMVSVPALPRGGLKQVLKTNYGPYDPSVWRLARWAPGPNGGRGSYDGYPALDTLRAGDAFWLTTKQGQGFALQQGRTVTADTTQEIPLKPGWNQVGNPFGFSVPWQVVIDSSGFSTDEIDGPVGYRDGGFTPGRDSLAPWRGYFVYNATGSPDTLKVPPVGKTDPSSQSLARKGGIDKAGTDKANKAPIMRPEAQLAAYDDGSTTKAGSDRYTLQVQALSKGNTAEATLGLWPEAKSGRGPYDHAQPPALTGGLRLGALETVGGKPVPHSHSIKPPTGRSGASGGSSGGPGGQSWTLRLSASEDGGTQQAKLRLTGSGALPSGHARYVLDLSRERRLTPGASLNLKAGETRRLKVILGTKAYAKDNNEGISLESFKTTLRANYPNPFADNTTVEYVVGEQQPVTIEIYNVLGQRVETLVDGRRSKGLHTAVWDGTNRYGNRVGSGVFFLRLRAGDVTETQKTVLVR